MSTIPDLIKVTTIEDVQTIMQAGAADELRLLPRGGGTKTALSAPRPDVAVLELRELRGILEYDPGEYTFTALAGTSIREVQAALAEHGQYLPFDPPFAESGATLGGTVAAGLSGSGRQRYGGVRDFLIGVRFVDGQGRLVRGGGKVVKNAAGFDLPKLMVGSIGRLGVLVELSFKVFPQPKTYTTVQTTFTDLAQAVEAMVKLSSSPLDVEALDLAPDDGDYRLWSRLGGDADVLHARAERLRDFVGAGEILTEDQDAELWHGAREFDWLPVDTSLVKVALNPSQVAGLEAQLSAVNAPRRYSVAGNLAWLAWPAPLAELDAMLTQQNLSGLVIMGACDSPLIGQTHGREFLQRIKQALDPQARLLDYWLIG